MCRAALDHAIIIITVLGIRYMIFTQPHYLEMHTFTEYAHILHVCSIVCMTYRELVYNQDIYSSLCICPEKTPCVMTNQLAASMTMPEAVTGLTQV